MMYPFCKYADETLVTFSNIIKNEGISAFDPNVDGSSNVRLGTTF